MSDPDAPPAVTVVNAAGRSPWLLVCEHASNHIPRRYDRLGLTPEDLLRHIAWDPGAADLARSLSARLDAPLVLSGYSRLLIDCNRPLFAPTSIPLLSEATTIPGNLDLPAAEVAYRQSAYFAPFQDRITRLLDGRVAAGRPGAILGIHSFTPIFLGQRRPWHAGVLYARASALGSALCAALSADGTLVIGDNEPYRIEPDHDHTVPVHGDARGIPAALMEVRQDLLADATAIESWAARLSAVLSAAPAMAAAGALA